MKDILDAYFECRDSLYIAFGYDGYAEYIDYNADCEWTGGGYGDFQYIMNDDVYSFDSAQLIGESDGYVLFNVYENGREYHAIFHRDKEITDEDELEEKFD